MWRHVQSEGFQERYTSDEIFRINVNKLVALAFVPVNDVVKAYMSIFNDFDHECEELLAYFEKTWVGQKRTRGIYQCVLPFCSDLRSFFILGSRRTKPLYAIELWNVYERVVQDLPRSNNSIEGWHRAFNCRVSIKHPSVTKLAKCIVREQTKFEFDIARIKVGQQPKPKKKIYATLDARFKRIVGTYSLESVSDYLGRIAANVKLNA